MAKDPPIATPLISKSPARIAGMLPETSTDNLKLRKFRFFSKETPSSGDPLGSFMTYVRLSEITVLLIPSCFKNLTVPLVLSKVPVKLTLLLSGVVNTALISKLPSLFRSVCSITKFPLRKKRPLLSKFSSV